MNRAAAFLASRLAAGHKTVQQLRTGDVLNGKTVFAVLAAKAANRFVIQFTDGTWHSVHKCDPLTF